MSSTIPAIGELSERSALDALLNPRSVAMIGASRNPAALGGRPLGFMASYGFRGKVYPVNGSADVVQGLPAYASILDLPEPVDLALIAVRAELVAQVLRDCVAVGVQVAVVMSSGFGEGMGAGEGILESIAGELAASGMRVLGPNCEGLASLPVDAPLTFSPVLDIEASGSRLKPGNIAVISQSGGLAFGIAEYGAARGMGSATWRAPGTRWTWRPPTSWSTSWTTRGPGSWSCSWRGSGHRSGCAASWPGTPSGARPWS
jgi:acyl-CoA synthetase (NDP forming)